MKMRWLGLGLGTVLTLAGVVVPSVTASADSTCYTGCSSPPPSSHQPTPATKVSVASDGLAFTGADIEEMTALGAGALVVGGVLVRRSRRRRLPA
ncbi:MAG TPA: hypothetical protein VID75_13105 [Acidimicrobiales bacterium]|jgi:hypothetical protein